MGHDLLATLNQFLYSLHMIDTDYQKSDFTSEPANEDNLSPEQEFAILYGYYSEEVNPE
jgi:hypothetical protein